MTQFTAAIEQALSIARTLILALLAVLIAVIGLRLLGVRVPYLAVSDGNLQSVAVFIAAAAYAVRS